MRHRAVPAATLIVAAGLIVITEWRLTRPVKDYRDRVTVEMSDNALHDTIASWPWDALKAAMRLADVAIVTA